LNSENYSRDIVVSSTPEAAYRALTSEYHKWWTLAADAVTAVGDTIKFQFDATYWVMRVNLLSPKYIELECVEAHHIHDGLPASILQEWEGSKLIWKIQVLDGMTKISLTHDGLIPSLDCFEVCKDGWDYFFVTSLKNYLNEGEGTPFKGKT
jgi:hypothetical protein